jgi:hypothetical protein
MGESLAIQQIGMAQTQEEPVRHPVVRSSSVTLAVGRSVEVWRCRAVGGRGVVLWWWWKNRMSKNSFFGLASEFSRNENQNYEHMAISKI